MPLSFHPCRSAACADGDRLTQDDFDTTVKGTVCTYDSFLLTDSLMDEFSGEIDLFRFDGEYGLDQQTAEDVSDHYPAFSLG